MVYTDKGKGQSIIFIHGFCETKEIWSAFEEALSSHYRVICPDLPGFGESTLDRDHIQLEEVASLLREWMQNNDIIEPIVIGHSLGGYVTLALAELMGSQLKAIGLLHSTAFADDKEKIEVRNRTLDFVERHGVKKFVDAFIPPLFAESSRTKFKSQIELLIKWGGKTSKNGLLAYTKAMRDRKDRMRILEKFPNPKLMIAGQLDSAVKIDASRLHRDFVDQYHEFPKTGHMGMIEQEERTISLIEDFILYTISGN